MRLNGWQRIGVIASIVWMIFAVINHLSNHDKLVSAIYSSEANACTVENMTLCMEDAYKQRSENWLYSDADKFDMAVGVFFPLLLAWASAYLSIFLARWVRSGFSKNSN